MATFSDHFSSTADSYAAFRPRYPGELFDHLASIAPARDCAWDCGTGNGQAALPLAERFARVVATDASARQIEHAPAHPRIEYRVAREDDSGIADAAADLVAVAQALHWFDLDRFYGEVRRVLRPGGILAAWTYMNVEIDAAVDPIVRVFYRERVGRWWPKERRHIEAGYLDLAFPFELLPAPDFPLTARVDRAAFLGYVSTWSAVKECKIHEGIDPTPELERALAAVWPAGEIRTARWPTAMRVGRNNDP